MRKFLTVFAALLLITVSAHSADRDSFAELDRLILNQPHVTQVLTKADLKTYYTANTKALKPTVNRTWYLAHLFRTVTAGKIATEAKAVAWTHWLQDHFAHPTQAPIDQNGTAIYDPIWLLKNRVAHCGQANRLIVDGLVAAGHKARLVQLASHVVAEAWWDGKWHYLDADLLSYGDFVRTSTGRIPSVAEIASMRGPFESLHLRLEYKQASRQFLIGRLKSVFTPKTYAHMSRTTPWAIYKTATHEQSKNVYYGWNHKKRTPMSALPHPSLKR